MPNNIYDNVSEKDLKTGYWYVTHRVLLRKLFILFLVAVAGGLIFFGAMGLIKQSNNIAFASAKCLEMLRYAYNAYRTFRVRTYCCASRLYIFWVQCSIDYRAAQ